MKDEYPTTKNLPLYNEQQDHIPSNDIHFRIYTQEEIIREIIDSYKYDIHISIAKGKGPPKLSFSKNKQWIPPKIVKDDHSMKRSFTKYVYVHAEYTEQMSMATLSLLSLCGFAQFGDRKVVRPYTRDSRITSTERNTRSLGVLYDLDYLGNLLNNAGYSPLVDKQEYLNECKPTDPNHVTIHFLYIGGVTKNWNLGKFKITEDVYDNIFEKTKATGWTDCSFLDNLMKITPSKTQYCINPTIIKDWSVLERDIVNGAKCLNIILWRGIGGGKYRSYFTEEHIKYSHTVLQYALKPSITVQHEVTKFQQAFLQDRYIAVYIRAELVLIPHRFDIDLFRNCLNVVVDVVAALKTITGINLVYLASDMSKYGSGSLLRNYLGSSKNKTNPFPEIFRSLKSRVGGVVYDYNPLNTEIVDRGAIALVDWSLLSHAQYLVTAGDEEMSSFVRLVIGSFLTNHQDDKELWSKISVCGK